MERLEALKHILTSDEAAQERGDMPLAEWSALLREHRDIRKEERNKMTVATKARENMTKLKTRRQQMEAEYVSLYEGLKQVEDASAERILEGAAVDKEMKRIAEQKAARDALAAAIELSKEREAAAAEILYEKELEQAWVDARKLWLASFKKIDKLVKALEKITTEYADLAETHKKLLKIGAPFAKTEGTLFLPEARIIDNAARMIEPFERQLKVIGLIRARYEESWTDERKKG